ncbi:MAG: hypothetical protein J6T70_06600 [Bacteroidales bacterium]|nr:hypothetical protein [Bacteroidales bacterium]
MIIISKFIFNKILKNYTGITLFPFIILKYDKNDKSVQPYEVVANHERIHLRQQLETLVVFFYPMYLIFYTINRFKGMKHYEAYRNIPFERESYVYESDLNYLKNRKFWNWRQFILTPKDGVISSR